jgi:GntR family transcriptional regulator
MNTASERFEIDHQSKLPLYDQIERNLRELIVSGKLETGDMLPSEWELAELYGVSRLTVRRALDELVRQHWLSKRHGVGTFVTKPSVASIAPSKLSFTDEMLAIGRRPGSQLIASGVEAGSPQVTGALALSQGDPVFYLTRVRLADDIPILLETAYLSAQRFPGLATHAGLAEGSLYQHLLDAYKVRVARVDQTLKPVLLTEQQAAHLQAKPGTPSIHTENIAYTGGGGPVEYAISISNGDHSEFYFTFKKEDM